jgi:pseudaminic acid synthase
MKKNSSEKIIISGQVIGHYHAPYIIAEMSANHNGNIENAFKIIDAAKRSGADAVKLQTYRPDTITIDSKNPEFMITKGLWSGQSLYELYEKAHMPWDWHKPLFDHAKNVGITIFSSPFDKTAIDLLENLGCPAYKIASFEIVDHALIKYAAETGKPLIISTGMASLEEITEAVSVAKGAGCNQLALLHCVSGYPASPEDYNLNTIKDLRERFDLVVGLSDHTISNVTANAAVALGASIIEKHFTLDRNGGGPDDSFSMEPSDLVDLCTTSRITQLAIGTENYEPLEAEKLSLEHRRSLYFVKDMVMGQVVSEDCVRSIRPGNGLKPKHLNSILGKRVSRDIKFGTPVNFDDF